MTVSQQQINYPLLRNPYHLIRQLIGCPLNKVLNKIVNQIVTLSQVIMNKIPKILHHQPLEEVPGAQKAYLLCAIDRSIYTAQYFQN